MQPIEATTHRNIALRPYQLEALDAIQRAEGRDVRRPLLQLPTGTGKTVVFAELIRRRGGRALVLAHRDELIQQAAAKIAMVAPGAQVGIVKAERDEHDAPVVVGSVATLARASRRARLRRDFSTVVVDEAHHATADSYLDILKDVGAFEPAGPLTLGVTATPERADGVGLGAVFQEIVYSAEILEMVRAGYLADLRAMRIRLEVDLDDVHMRGGDLVAGELEAALLDAHGPKHVAQAYIEHAAERRGIIFTPTVKVAHAMGAALRDAGIAAEALDGETPEDERRGILARLHTGETQVVANCAVLTEGFDEPAVDCIVIARPTASRPLYVQMVGRGTRTWPGKRDCLILDVVGSTRRHKLASATDLFGLDPDALDDGETVVAASAARDAKLAQQVAEGRLIAEAVELFESAELRWIEGRGRSHVLSVGERGLVVLRPTEGHLWCVEHVENHQRDRIAEGLDLGYAMGAAEDFARKLGAGKLVSREATWRNEPATEKQLAALRRWRVKAPPGLTRGTASDLLTAAIARRVA